jgi:hypothetical protein
LAVPALERFFIASTPVEDYEIVAGQGSAAHGLGQRPACPALPLRATREWGVSAGRASKAV